MLHFTAVDVKFQQLISLDSTVSHTNIQQTISKLF